MAEDNTLLEKLREAWDNMPPGAKNKLYSDHEYTNQNVRDILKNGRKDKNVLVKLIDDIKSVSSEITEDINALNEKVQAV